MLHKLLASGASFLFCLNEVDLCLHAIEKIGNGNNAISAKSQLWLQDFH